uniref:Uncharacterized protein n=1 Tax=Oryza brachyantha TaxID=4533 RepID=J3LVN1_ORYBR
MSAASSTSSTGSWQRWSDLRESVDPAPSFKSRGGEGTGGVGDGDSSELVDSKDEADETVRAIHGTPDLNYSCARCPHGSPQSSLIYAPGEHRAGELWPYGPNKASAYPWTGEVRWNSKARAVEVIGHADAVAIHGAQKPARSRPPPINGASPVSARKRRRGREGSIFLEQASSGRVRQTRGGDGRDMAVAGVDEQVG